MGQAERGFGCHERLQGEEEADSESFSYYRGRKERRSGDFLSVHSGPPEVFKRRSMGSPEGESKQDRQTLFPTPTPYFKRKGLTESWLTLRRDPEPPHYSRQGQVSIGARTLGCLRQSLAVWMGT